MKYTRYFFIILFVFSVSLTDAQTPTLRFSRADSANAQKYLNDYEIYNKKDNKREASRQLNSLAKLHWEHYQYEKAIKYYKLSLGLNKQLGNENAVSMINNNLAVMYSDLGKYNKSVEHFNITIAYRRAQRENREALISSLFSISIPLVKQKKYSEAAEYLEEALQYSLDENNTDRVRTCYGNLAEVYEKAGEKEKANDSFEKYKSLNEQLNRRNVSNYEKAQRMAMQADYERVKKQNELLLKEKELNRKNQKLVKQTKKLIKTEGYNQELTENLSASEQERKNQEIKTEIEKQRRKDTILLFSVGGILLIITLIAIGISLSHKKKANIKLKAQNEEILKTQKQLSKANKNISEQNKKITGGINYAKLIQTAMMHKPDKLKEYLADSFIFFKPRDIVSGDFYWYTKTDQSLILAAVDCTGHGVPGAFLSMIGNQLLNRLIINQKITNPAEIITKLDKEVKLALNQEYTKNHDGMDIAICVICNDKKTLRYAGARNPLVLIQNGKHRTIKGNPYSVGGGYSKRIVKKFNEHIINIKTPTSFYIYSDGFQDQTNNKKKK